MLENREKQIDEWIGSHRVEMVRELMDFVRHPSVSRADLSEPGAPYGQDVRKMLDFALERFESFGFRTENHDGYCGSAWYGDAAEEIGFYAHLDVVPEGPNWIYEPWNPVEREGFVIGRGADDNKAAAVIGLFIMRFLKEHGIRLHRSFRVMMGCAEETGMDDFRQYQLRGGKLPDFGIVADAGFPVCYAQKGGWNADILVPKGSDILDFSAGNVRNACPGEAFLVLRADALKTAEYLSEYRDLSVEDCGNGELRITAKGRGGHAAFPEGTDNAATKLAEAVSRALPAGFCDIRGLDFIAECFRNPYGAGMGFSYEDEISGKLSSNAGVFRTDEQGIHVLLDIRYPVTAPIGEMTENFKKKLSENGVVLENLSVENPFYIDKEDPRVRILQECYREITGGTEEPYAMGGGTYSRVIPGAVTFGPGLRSGVKPGFLPEGHGGAHGPDEVLHIESWLGAFKIYLLSILKLAEASDR